MKDHINSYDVLIIGGGLAGLSASIHLQKHNVRVLVVEKTTYPKHKVCGEYISNEVLPYLNYVGIDVFKLGAKRIDKFQLSTPKNKHLTAVLQLGGFGISRYTLDHALFLKATELGVTILQDLVIDTQFIDDEFIIKTKENSSFKAKIVIGAYGKRSNLDIKLNRNFIQNKSPFLAVKTHIKGNFPENLVALHNFEGGYCGVSMVEDGSINVCYIADFDSFKKYKDIEEFQHKVVYKNTFLKSIFENSTPVFEAPLTISQISFSSKSPIEDHIIMCGDSAGMIHPLCGNGMSMAIRSAQLASEGIIDYLQEKIILREELEQSYVTSWNKAFKSRLKVGHIVANIFGKKKFAEAVMVLLKNVPMLVPMIIKKTHGKPMKVR